MIDMYAPRRILRVRCNLETPKALPIFIQTAIFAPKCGPALPVHAPGPAVTPHSSSMIRRMHMLACQVAVSICVSALACSHWCDGF